MRLRLLEQETGQAMPRELLVVAVAFGVGILKERSLCGSGLTINGKGPNQGSGTKQFFPLRIRPICDLLVKTVDFKQVVREKVSGFVPDRNAAVLLALGQS